MVQLLVGYDPRERMYHIMYKDGDEEWLFHNEMHSYKDKIDSNKMKLYSEMLKPKLKFRPASKPRLEPTPKPIKLKKERYSSKILY